MRGKDAKCNSIESPWVIQPQAVRERFCGLLNLKKNGTAHATLMSL